MQNFPVKLSFLIPRYAHASTKWKIAKVASTKIVVFVNFDSITEAFLHTSQSLTGRSSVIRQKGESQNGGKKKTNHARFSEKANISYPLIRTRTY